MSKENFRDNFAKPTVTKLRNRVSDRCSNPECRTPTGAPGTGNDGTTTIGIAAHIRAASKGGPRYCELQSEEERKSINNGLWLCSPCATKIDRDTITYHPELLHQWKSAAETKAKKELGRRLPHEDDAIDQLVTALTGNARELMPSAIHNTHRAMENVLERLDPRFKVKSKYMNLNTTIEFRAKDEPVSFSFKAKSENDRELPEKFRHMLDHGDELNVSLKDVEIYGLPVVEKILGQDGTLSIYQHGKQAIHQIWLTEPETGKREEFYEVAGSLTVGSKSYKFNGKMCGGMLSFCYQKNFNCLQTSIELTVHFSTWNERDIRSLPYFDKLRSLYKKMAGGWKLNTVLEFEGIAIAKGECAPFCGNEYISNMDYYLEYIANARAIATYTNSAVIFDENFVFSSSDFGAVEAAAKIIAGKTQFTQVAQHPKCAVLAAQNAQNIRDLQAAANGDPICIKIVTDVSNSISIFGHTVELPRRMMYMANVLPLITLPKHPIQEGDAVQVEWVPCANFHGMIQFMSNDEKACAEPN